MSQAWAVPIVAVAGAESDLSWPVIRPLTAMRLLVIVRPLAGARGASLGRVPTRTAA